MPTQRKLSFASNPFDFDFALRFYIPLNTELAGKHTLQPISWLVLKKLNLAQQVQTFIHNIKILQHKINAKKCLVASYDLQPGNGAGYIVQFPGLTNGTLFDIVVININVSTKMYNNF